MFKKIMIRASLRLAWAHSISAQFWNDVAESLLTGRSISEIRKERKGQNDD